MPKPQMIRADTIDLQNQHSPSAKDHSRQPASPGAIGEGPPAPHQAAALRHASLDESSLLGRSPRASQDLSGKELQLLHEQHSDIDDQDAHDIEASLGIQRGDHMQDGEGDEDDEEGMDDDMIDKISSSPSIDDGGYPTSPPPEVEDCPPAPAAGGSLFADSDPLSSSPYTDAPVHYPLGLDPENVANNLRANHHQMPGEYPASADSRSEGEDTEDSDETVVPANESPSGPRTSSLPTTRESNEGAPSESSDGAPSYGNMLESGDESSQPTTRSATSNKADSSSRPASYRAANDDRVDDSNDDDLDEDTATEHGNLDHSRFLDSGWGGESLREPEDIDFEFVYALHTFVATVEGQANATKGDTMVLLDDSNSYWWLVRVVKDSSIGYLPAEHIETPTERLARLNKHRNIDLSQTMLGDNPERSRNPLKKAMRRRNVKTVQFTDPTYYEPDPIEYSSEEEGEDDMEFLTTADVAHDQAEDQIQQDQSYQNGQQAQEQNHGEHAVQPLRIRGAASRDEHDDDVNGANGAYQAQADPRIDRPRASEDSIDSDDGNGERGNRRIRNTDSFYKDENIETRKIILTPNILREESNSPGPRASDARASLESGEKQVTAEKPKEDKKKKPSKFGGLFSRRRDRKSKQQPEGEVDEALVKRDSQPGSRTSPQPQAAEVVNEPVSPRDPQPQQQPARQTSKLQKQPRGGSLRRTSSQEESGLRGSTPTAKDRQRAIPSTISETDPFDDSAAVAEQQPQRSPSASNGNSRSNSRSNSRVTSPTSESLRNVFNPVREAFRSTAANAEPEDDGDTKVEKVKKAKARMALDDSDESADEKEHRIQPAAPKRRAPDPIVTQPAANPALKERLSESPVQVVSPVEQRHPAGRGALAHPNDSSSHSSRGDVSPVSPSESPELVEHPQGGSGTSYESSSATRAAGLAAGGQPWRPSTPPTSGPAGSASTTPASHSTTTSRQAPQWSDALLRSYMETSTDDIRDLLVVVGDTSGVAAPGSEHPTVKSFEGDRQRLAAMDQRLDAMLKGLMARRGVGPRVGGVGGGS